MIVEKLISSISDVSQAMHKSIADDDFEALAQLTEQREVLVKSLCEHTVTDPVVLSSIKGIIEDTNTLTKLMMNAQISGQVELARINQTRKALNQYDHEIPQTEGYFIDKYK